MSMLAFQRARATRARKLAAKPKSPLINHLVADAAKAEIVTDKKEVKKGKK